MEVSTPMSRWFTNRRWPRRVAAVVLAAAVAATGAVLGLAAPASAHGQFVNSDPARDSTVSMPLASIVLWFTEKPTSNAFFSVTAPSGARVDRLWSHGSSRRLDVPVHEYYHNANGEWETRRYDTAYTALIPIAYWPEVGAYKVTFVSVATDGEPVRGDFTFKYDGALTAAPGDFRPQKNEPDPNLLAVTKSDQPTAPPSAGPVAADQATGESGPGVWIVLIPVGLALVVALVMFLFWRFRPQARQVLVSRFGGRYAAPPAPRKPLQLPPQLEQLRGKLPLKRR
jgi:methionine-rich copper-binding protein CopC